MKRYFCLFIFLFSFQLLTFKSQAINFSPEEDVIRFKTYLNDVFIDGNYAYVTDGYAGIQVVDISTPSNPSHVGSYNPSSGQFNGLYVKDGYIYTSMVSSGTFFILDASDPSHLSLKSSYNLEGNHYEFLATVNGSYAYMVATAEDGSYGDYRYLAIVSLVDLANPEEVSRLDLDCVIEDVSVNGNYAYVSCGSDGLKIINISTPSSPSLVKSYALSAGAYALTVSGNYAYVSTEEGGLSIINISTPSLPSTVGAYTPSSSDKQSPTQVLLNGTKIYIAGEERLNIINVSSKTSPTKLGSFDTDSSYNVYGVAVKGDYAYITGQALEVLNVSDASDPSQVISYNTSGFSQSVVVSGNYAYIGTLYDGLQVILLSDFSSYGSYEPSVFFGYGLTVSGNILYVANGTSGLSLLDISDPSSPSAEGSYNTSGTAVNVAVSGNYAYVADDTKGLQIINISNPSSPSLTKNYPTLSKANAVVVSGNYAYVAEDSHLEIINISTPSSPSFKGSLSLYGLDIEIKDDDAYVATSGGFHVVDISNPASPSLITTYSSSDTPWDIFIEGNYAYLTLHGTGIEIVDISDPKNPKSVLELNENELLDSQCIYVDGDYIYVCSNAFYRLEHECGDGILGPNETLGTCEDASLFETGTTSGADDGSDDGSGNFTSSSSGGCSLRI